MSVPLSDFCHAYAQHRAEEGRAFLGDELRSLPYLETGPLARQWAVRARSYEVFVNRVVKPLADRRPLDVLDLGAGNGWLCRRLAGMGHRAVALDVRDDEVDGLGAAKCFLDDAPGEFACLKASFDGLPFADRLFDLTLFNASLHYATDLCRVLVEAARVTRKDGAIAILDSPFYGRERDGQLMVAEKRKQGAARFGNRAEILLGRNVIEFLTVERLANALVPLSWTCHRARYPLWYEMRPLLAWLRGNRRPSRFDVWTARVP
jgi:SAM-dependent methyltransferase